MINDTYSATFISPLLAEYIIIKLAKQKQPLDVRKAKRNWAEI